MFEDKKLLVTGGTGSIGSSICSYFNDNNCKEIYSTTTNINKIKSDQNYIKFKELDLNNIENLNLDELFDFEIDFNSEQILGSVIANGFAVSPYEPGLMLWWRLGSFKGLKYSLALSSTIPGPSGFGSDEMERNKVAW